MAEHYDLVVIGGGSGGLAASKAAAGYGKKVCVLDYVKPSPLGSQWEIGGTCVNVGCIPKKLMHKAGLHGEDIEVASRFGWEVKDRSFHWEKLVDNVQNYIKSLNYGYKQELKSENVTYLRALGTFVDSKTLSLDFGPGKESENRQVTADRILIAVGGRPKQLTCPGGEHALTSDDIFSYKKVPGKTCVVGASYVALEIAGFLSALGFEVTVLVRSILLRGFDQEMAELIKGYMTNHGTKFVDGVTPKSIVKDEATGKFAVTYGGKDGDTTEEFDTVLQGIGRYYDTENLGLDKAGVQANKYGEIPVEKEQTNVPHIYAIGDCIEGPHELTPVAIQAGKMLSARLYGAATLFMDYHTIATTVFTPLEYGTIGYPEEDALAKFGEANIETYHTKFAPLEWSLPEVDFEKYDKWEADKTACYCKLICLKNEDERVVGFHYAGPNAGEVTQGFSTAMRLGATKLDFDMTIGIHPSCSENFTTLKVTKSSGESAEAAGC